MEAVGVLDDAEKIDTDIDYGIIVLETRLWLFGSREFGYGRTVC